MATKKSKAVAAAERAADRAGRSADRASVDDENDGRRPWTRSMVERAILAFNDIDRIPPYDEEGVRALVRDFVRFVALVERGGVVEDAMPLAQTFIEQGWAWLRENPRYAPVHTTPWTLHMVEQLILWFNDATSGARDKRRVHEVAEKLHTFETVWKSGAVVDEADSLAQAFIEYAHRWLESQPDALAHFESLA
jgi:hypothetical protein